MGNAFLNGQSGGGASAPNLYATPSNGATYPEWFTREQIIGAITKTNWTKAATLVSSEYSSAVAWVNCRMGNLYNSYTQIGEMNVEVPGGYWGSAFQCLFKLEKDEDGRIAIYFRLADDSVWDNAYWNSGGAGQFTDIAILPIA